MNEWKPLGGGHHARERVAGEDVPAAARDGGACGGGTAPVRGGAVQIDPIKPKLKLPGNKRLKLDYVGLLSNLVSSSTCTASSRCPPSTRRAAAWRRWSCSPPSSARYGGASPHRSHTHVQNAWSQRLKVTDDELLFQRLKSTYDEVLSTFACKLKLRRYR